MAQQSIAHPRTPRTADLSPRAVQRACEELTKAASQARFTSMLLEQQRSVTGLVEKASDRGTVEDLQHKMRGYARDFLGTHASNVGKTLDALQDVALDMGTALGRQEAPDLQSASQSAGRAGEEVGQDAEELEGHQQDSQKAAKQLVDVLDAGIKRLESDSIKNLEEEIRSLEQKILDEFDKICEASAKFGRGISKILGFVVNSIAEARAAISGSAAGAAKEKKPDAKFPGLPVDRDPQKGAKDTNEANKEIADAEARIYRHTRLLRQKYMELARANEALSAGVGLRIALSAHKDTVQTVLRQQHAVAHACSALEKTFAETAASGQQVPKDTLHSAQTQWDGFGKRLLGLTKSLSNDD
ncbi:hypothetical protein [Streptomyces spiramyceticus]|uniref:hypothetical protein n=1 Tax=Streptomyces spiramyceticus TaxID=299717 RepID=UPI00237B6759|nr:hypothetical protein [Streptomyces spiramyceticus]